MQEHNEIEQTWDSYSDEHFGKLDYAEIFKEIGKDPYRGFPKAVAELLAEYFPDLRGKKVCVPSCGDCVAAFAFCEMGAEVFAADISCGQIENARKRAEGKNYNIKFLHSDSMSLNELNNDFFDLVYTSNGVHVWIRDLTAMYKNFSRILKKGGIYIMFDMHPWSRPFDKGSLEEGKFVIRKPYEETGPFLDDVTYDWRIQDYVNALVSSGFSILRMEEFHSIPEDLPNHNYLSDNYDEPDKYDWHKNPCAALPQCLGFVCRKPG